MIAADPSRKKPTIQECISSLETLFKAYQKDSEFNYQLTVSDSPFNRLREYVSKLKSIEDELGIDLTTLFKALENGIWTRGGWYRDQLEKEPEYVKSPEIGICSYYDECDENYIRLLHDENVMCIYTYDYEIMVRQTRLKDYGRTWALSKEELL